MTKEYHQYRLHDQLIILEMEMGLHFVTIGNYRAITKEGGGDNRSVFTYVMGALVIDTCNRGQTTGSVVQC